MNSNRGQYNSAPLYNMKNRKKAQAEQPASQGEGPKPAGKGKRYQALSIVLSLVLPVLFLLCLLIPNTFLRVVFLGAVAASLLMMWALSAFVKSARSTLTVVYIALALVIVVAMLVPGGDPVDAGTRGGDAQAGAFSNFSVSVPAAPTQEPTEEPEDQVMVSAAQQRLEEFLAQWALSHVDEMVKYCQPAWVSAQSSPETMLYQLVQGSRPVSFSVESTEGSDSDNTRTITIRVLFNENDNTQVWKRLQVLMFRVNDVWYVGPQSLGGVIIDESTLYGGGPTPTMAASTIAPTATPNPNGGSGITVYYNKDGGKYYHAKPNCPSVAERYWGSLTSFSFDLINSQEYKNLVRCPECNPPERPAVGQ